MLESATQGLKVLDEMIDHDKAIENIEDIQEIGERQDEYSERLKDFEDAGLQIDEDEINDEYDKLGLDDMDAGPQKNVGMGANEQNQSNPNDFFAQQEAEMANIMSQPMSGQQQPVQ